MGILLVLIGLVMIGYAAGFWLGWSHREDRFQKNPTVYVKGVEDAVYVDNTSGPKVRVIIYNKKLVEVTEA